MELYKIIQKQPKNEPTKIMQLKNLRKPKTEKRNTWNEINDRKKTATVSLWFTILIPVFPNFLKTLIVVIHDDNSYIQHIR